MKQKAKTTQSCPYFIIIDSSKIPIADQPQWQTDNLPYMASTPVGNRVEIEPHKIPSGELAQWLFDNQNYITYTESYQYIECVHTITTPSDIKELEDAPELCRMTYAMLIAAIRKAGISSNSPSYEKYACLSITKNKLSVSAVTQFGTQPNCYSIPFFKSILANNPTFDTTSILVFKQPEAVGELEQKICISVEVSGNMVKNYDFSQMPP